MESAAISQLRFPPPSAFNHPTTGVSHRSFPLQIFPKQRKALSQRCFKASESRLQKELTGIEKLIIDENCSTERDNTVELLECLEKEAIMGEDKGRNPDDYNRRAQIFDTSSKVFQALKHSQNTSSV